MDETSTCRNRYHRQTLAKSFNHNRTSTNRSNSFNGGDDVAEEEECELEVWQTLSGGFKRVQSVLDQNRALIQQVNENHQSKVPENLVKNVDLIREINGNITKVVSFYSDLSVNFSDLIHQRKAITKNSDRNKVVDSVK